MELHRGAGARSKRLCNKELELNFVVSDGFSVGM